MDLEAQINETCLETGDSTLVKETAHGIISNTRGHSPIYSGELESLLKILRKYESEYSQYYPMFARSSRYDNYIPYTNIVNYDDILQDINNYCRACFKMFSGWRAAGVEYVNRMPIVSSPNTYGLKQFKFVDYLMGIRIASGKDLCTIPKECFPIRCTIYWTTRYVKHVIIHDQSSAFVNLDRIPVIPGNYVGIQFYSIGDPSYAFKNVSVDILARVTMFGIRPHWDLEEYGEDFIPRPDGFHRVVFEK